MSNQNKLWSRLDSYTLQARVAPAFVVLIAPIFGLYVWFPDALKLELGIAASILSVALSALVGQLGRDLGKRKEPGLFEGWGGAPTVRFLRHRNTQFNAVLRARCHVTCRQLAPDLTLPSPDEERQDPESADTVYEACTRLLIAWTRDKERFPLIFKENVSYGFCRNLWAMRPLGLALGVLGAAFAIGHLLRSWRIDGVITGAEVIASIVSTTLLLLWYFWFTTDWVRIRADAYAERLLEACEHLPVEGHD